MHTPGKWTVREDNRKPARLNIWADSYLIVANNIWSKEDANRIVTMHNSFDGLLEACKSMIKNLQKEKLTQYVDFHIRKQMKYAIKKAEDNS